MVILNRDLVSWHQYNTYKISTVWLPKQDFCNNIHLHANGDRGNMSGPYP